MLQVKLNISLLEDISDDIDFCFKLAKEESVVILPGMTWYIYCVFISSKNFLISLGNSFSVAETKSSCAASAAFSNVGELVLLFSRKPHSFLQLNSNSIPYILKDDGLKTPEILWTSKLFHIPNYVISILVSSILNKVYTWG